MSSNRKIKKTFSRLNQIDHNVFKQLEVKKNVRKLSKNKNNSDQHFYLNPILKEGLNKQTKKIKEKDQNVYEKQIHNKKGQKKLKTLPNQQFRLSLKKSKSKSKSRDKSKCNTYRPMKKSTKSTKFITERSEIKDSKNIPKGKKKKIKGKKKEKSETFNKNRIKDNQNQHLSSNLQKFKRSLQIKTQQSDRKASFFDDKLLRQMNFTTEDQFMDSKGYSTKPTGRKNVQQFEDSDILQKYFIDKNEQEKKQYLDKSIQAQLKSNQSQYKRKYLTNFKTIQTLKWRIMLLQLNNLKSNPNKIDTIINQSNINYKQLQQQVSIIKKDNQLTNNYIFENPLKIKQLLSFNNSNHQDNNQKILKNLSDKKLLKQLQMFQPIDNKYQIDKNISQEFQKQLQQYSSANFGQNKKNQHLQILDDDIQLVENKRLISIKIFNILFDQFSQELTKSKKILHQFLKSSLADQQKSSNKSDIEKIQQQCGQIQCSKQYTIQLFTRLFNFIQNNQQFRQKFINALNIPFGINSLKTLQWIRDSYLQNYESNNILQENSEQYFEINEDNDIESEQVVIITSVLQPQLITEFQLKNMNEIIQEQYFYNHCVYNCINEILDIQKPYGLAGKPCLPNAIATSKARPYTDFYEIIRKIAKRFVQILNIRMGKINFDDEPNQNIPQAECIKLVNKCYQAMDQAMVEEQDLKWQNMEDYAIQYKYKLAQIVIEQIFNDETMIVFTQFLP